MLPCRNAIVPFTMPFVYSDVEAAEFLIVNFDALDIFVRIQIAFHLETRFRSGVADEIHDDFIVLQRSSAPVLADECEQSMFDLVPLGSAGGKCLTKIVRPTSSANL